MNKYSKIVTQKFQPGSLPCSNVIRVSGQKNNQKSWSINYSKNGKKQKKGKIVYSVSNRGRQL